MASLGTTAADLLVGTDEDRGVTVILQGVNYDDFSDPQLLL